jgi:[protein-PII] uridylyltransferase
MSIAFDSWLSMLFEQASITNKASSQNFALIAVGSYGRQELGPSSDLDLVLIHEEGVSPNKVAEALWYPIWDAGVDLDHSVRSIPTARKVASEDIKAFTGLLDARWIAGNEELARELRNSIHHDWRANAKNVLPQLSQLVSERRKTHGELFQLLEPNIKESYGGIRDAGIVNHLSSTWLIDTPRTEWEISKNFLLDVRDAMSLSLSGDRLHMQSQATVALEMGLADPETLLKEIYLASRKIAYTSELTWYRINALLDQDKPSIRQLFLGLRGSSGKIREPLAQGVIDSGSEITLARNADLASDPGLLLRIAGASALTQKPISPYLLEREVSIRTPWDREMRESFVSLLGSGTGLLNTWEALDQYGIIEKWFPEWSNLRSAPQFNVLHEFTVDRHLIECVIQAQSFVRTVERPDLLLVAAFLHDIGKCQDGDHSEIGAEMTRVIAPRIAFDSADTEVLEQLVLYHLLLPDIATKRDLDDPQVISDVASKVRDAATLDLLLALSLSDSRATGPSLRSQWREGLLRDLARRVRLHLAGDARELAPVEPTDIQLRAANQDALFLEITREDHGFRITVGAPDQIGLVAKVAGILAMNRLAVRAAKISTVGERAIQEWYVRPLFGDPPAQEILYTDLVRTVAGTFDVEAAMAKRTQPRAPRTQTSGVGGSSPAQAQVSIERVSGTQVVLEVRAPDAPALLYKMASCIAREGVEVVGAKISTLGVDTVDVFFVKESGGAELSEPRARSLIEALESELALPAEGAPVTLG